MSNFMTLVKFEIKKIMKKKAAMVTLVIMMLTMAVVSCMEFVMTIDGQSGVVIFGEYRENMRKLSGRPIDSELIKAMQEDFAGKEPDKVNDMMTESYYDIYIFVKNIFGEANVFNPATPDTLYERRAMLIENNYIMDGLTEGEKDYWREKVSEIETPFIYNYTYGSSKAMVEFYTCSVLMVLFIAVALAAVFADEYNKGMDKLIMSTKFGKVQTYFAKLTGGVIFALVGSLLIIMSGVIPTLIVHGADGMNSAVQLYMEMSPFPMAIGEVILMFLLIYIVAAVMLGVLTMFFSQVFKSSITSMGIMIALLLVAMCVTVPEEWRVLSQIFGLLPSNVLAIWSLYDTRLIPFFGGYLTNLEFAPVAYTAVIILTVVVGRLIQIRREEV